MCVALVANKIDKEKREVSPEEGIKLGQDIDYPFYEASAKEGKNINECFDNLIKQLYSNYGAATSMNDTSKLSDSNIETRKCC